MASTVILSVIGLFFVGVCFFMAWKAWSEGREQHRWNRVEATVVETMLGSRGDSIAVGKGLRPTTYYFPQVRYRYFVDGKEHESKNKGGVYFESNFHEMMKRRVAALTRRYPPGAVVPAYVNPKDPDDAVLTRGQPAWVIAMLFGFGLASGLGWALLILHDLGH